MGLPPDFLWSLVALASLMRLSLLKAAHVAVGQCRVSGNPGRPSCSTHVRESPRTWGTRPGGKACWESGKRRTKMTANTPTRARIVHFSFNPPSANQLLPRHAGAGGMTNLRVATHLGSGGGGWTESTNGCRHTHPGCQSRSLDRVPTKS
jgi:hypothetical protein